MPEYFSSDITLNDVNSRVENATTQFPSKLYFLAIALLGMGILGALVSWIVQVRTGMGVSGLGIPVGWATYITNFVFWVGIAHSGTLISAILYLVRAKWRDAISRSSEAMTLIAIMIAGLFPLVHLGRLWSFWYILPYPSQRQLWPNFKSPLVWDVVAVFTYFTVSLMFFVIGLIPDAAVYRDRFMERYGDKDPRTKLFSLMAAGWSGALSQWSHYNRSYLFFAAFATPLVISVHSIVSWDFAMSLLPGWHSTIFAPYFVAGAIHSGLAMVLLIMIPMRNLFHLEGIITVRHLEMIGRTAIVTTLIVGYAYIIEPMIAHYSQNIFEIQFESWRASSWLSWSYYTIIICNVLVPLSLIFRKVRTNPRGLFIVSLFIIAGMWLERFFIIVGSTAHDFMPHAWGFYAPRTVEYLITLGSFSLFFFLFLIFSKTLPVVPVVDFKSQIEEEKITYSEESKITARLKKIKKNSEVCKMVFSDPDKLLRAAKLLCGKGFDRLEVFTPVKIEKLGEILNLPKSPVRYWLLAGSVSGAAIGVALTVYASQLNNLIVGGKQPVAMIPYLIIVFECTILFGSFGNLFGFIFHSRLFGTTKPGYDSRFSKDKYGIVVQYNDEQYKELKDSMRKLKPDEGKYKIRV